MMMMTMMTRIILKMMTETTLAMMTMTLGLNKHMKIGGRLGCNAGRLADKKGQEKNVNDHNEDDWKSSKDVCYFDALFVFLKKKNYR